jgi:hypothetical protein
VPAFVLALLLTALAGQTAAPQRRPLLDVTSRVSSERVAPGDRFSIALDLTPAPRIHVYAPEVTGYKPLALTVKPQAGLIVRSAIYPPSETYYYAPLKETVPVYQKPFRVVQELMLDGSPAGRAALRGMTSLTVQGTLSYQACDDRICFPPRSVPMTWTVIVKEPS